MRLTNNLVILKIIHDHTHMQRNIFSLLMFLPFFPNMFSHYELTHPQFLIPNKQMIEISLIYESRPVRQILKPTHNVSNPINIVSFGASLLLCYRSSLHATKVSHILVCIFVLCLSPCHGCVANTSVTLRSNMAAASASPLRCSL